MGQQRAAEKTRAVMACVIWGCVSDKCTHDEIIASRWYVRKSSSFQIDMVNTPLTSACMWTASLTPGVAINIAKTSFRGFGDRTRVPVRIVNNELHLKSRGWLWYHGDAQRERIIMRDFERHILHCLKLQATAQKRQMMAAMMSSSWQYRPQLPA